MSKKKQEAQRKKREVIRVEGKAPGIRSKEERIALLSRVERYLLADTILRKLLNRRLLTKSEYRSLERRNAEHAGLAENSLFRSYFEAQ